MLGRDQSATPRFLFSKSATPNSTVARPTLEIEPPFHTNELFEPTMESSASSRRHDQGWRRQSIASAKNAAIWPGEHFLTTLRITCPTTLSSPLCALK